MPLRLRLGTLEVELFAKLLCLLHQLLRPQVDLLLRDTYRAFELTLTLSELRGLKGGAVPIETALVVELGRLHEIGARIATIQRLGVSQHLEEVGFLLPAIAIEITL